ncbi:MAG TPA: aminopeptidase [Kofleriaceae bacterium]|nr:aminopeptidase [Kofleriaceae bacterium]
MTTRLIPVAALALASGIVAAQPAAKPQAPVKPPPVVDYTALAEKLVATSAHVKEGEVVAISGGTLDLPLLEDIAIAVRKRGAFPFITIDTDKIAKAMNTQVPDKYDAQSPKLALALARVVDVYITIPAVRDPGIAAMLAPDRAARRAKASQAVEDARRARRARVVELDNGLAPSWSRANDLGIAEAELAKIFWDGLNADFTVVEAKCKTLRDTIAAGKQLHITHANGTDITLAVKGRKTYASDGVTSDADLQAGGPAVQVWLPAGDVYTTPAPGTAKGKLVDDRMVFLGKEITGVTVEIANGKVTSVSAKSGWDAIKARYDAAGPGKTEVGFVDLGCNPAVRTGGKLETWMGAGMVTIGIGGNAWAGGTNKEPFSLAYQLAGATVSLDGKILVENGQLK